MYDKPGKVIYNKVFLLIHVDMDITMFFKKVGRVPTLGNNFYMQIKAAITEKWNIGCYIKTIWNRDSKLVSMPMFCGSKNVINSLLKALDMYMWENKVYA